MLRALTVGLTLLAFTAGVARASDVAEPPVPLELPLTDDGLDAVFAAALAFGDLDQPLGVAWTGGVLVLAFAESLHVPLTMTVGDLQLRPLVAPDASLSVGLGLRGRF